MPDDTLPDGYAGLTFPWTTPPAEGEVTEVSEGVLWARLPLPMALDHVNIYFLREDDGWAMVDTGFDTKRTRAILQKLRAGPLGGDPITRLLVTHHHPDHVGLAGWLQSLGTELLMTRTAWLMARMLTLDDQPLPTPETIAFCRRWGMDADIMAKRATERPFNFADIVAPLPVGVTRLHEGEDILFGGRRWRAATATRRNMRFSTKSAAIWCWAAISFCPVSRPILASIRRKRTPTPSVTGWRPAIGLPRSRGPIRWCCPVTSCRIAAFRPG
ncbi:Metallo-beta-lactamase superfamily protein [Jannaschia donghaensis]|uniref:Metallo-beta-lactamase superfamily protein n=1 Tax=Jannaschia donghaensis TaxID=420998 RepID=A0A0M6YEY4_9RHOB|nr:Metallo-beta-lactamase superfamily protein [Jannaschia donghaensis]